MIQWMFLGERVWVEAAPFLSLFWEIRSGYLVVPTTSQPTPGTHAGQDTHPSSTRNVSPTNDSTGARIAGHPCVKYGQTGAQGACTVVLPAEPAQPIAQQWHS